MQQQQGGFTLIELMMGVAIMGIILALGVPQFQNLVHRNRVSTEVNRFISHVQFARSESIRRGEVISLCQSGSLSLCASDDNMVASGVYEEGWLVYADRSGAADNYDNAEDVLLRIGDPAPVDVTIRADSSAGRWMSFGWRGELSNLQASVAFCHEGEATQRVPGRLVTIHATGRATVAEIAAGGSCSP